MRHPVRTGAPGSFARRAVANGVVDQLGVHGIDLVEQLLGRVRNVSARARIARPERRLRDGTLVEVETIDNASATYELDDGTLVAHEMSMTEFAGCDRFRMEIYGEKGTLWLRTERGRLAAFVPARFGPGWHVPELPNTPLGQRQHAVWLAGIAGDAPRLATADDAVARDARRRGPDALERAPRTGRGSRGSPSGGGRRNVTPSGGGRQ